MSVCRSKGTGDRLTQVLWQNLRAAGDGDKREDRFGRLDQFVIIGRAMPGFDPERHRCATSGTNTGLDETSPLDARCWKFVLVAAPAALSRAA
jgi:hypothetical protein